MNFQRKGCCGTAAQPVKVPEKCCTKADTVAKTENKDAYCAGKSETECCSK